MAEVVVQGRVEACAPAALMAASCLQRKPDVSLVSAMTAALVCILLNALGAAALPIDPPQRLPEAARLSVLAPTFAAGRSQAPLPTQPAKGRFLVAHRSVNDPRFAETVILLIAYSDEGAMGIIINRPTDVRLALALPEMKELRDRRDRLFVGGPVSPSAMLLLIRSATAPEGAQPVFGDVHVSGKLETLRKVLGKNGKNDRLRAYAGYAGWGPGQLEHEIARGDWAVGPADAATIFDTPSEGIWQKLIDRFSVQWARAPEDRLVVAERKIDNVEPRIRNGQWFPRFPDHRSRQEHASF
jgi:putative transcriptional regulator